MNPQGKCDLTRDLLGRRVSMTPSAAPEEVLAFFTATSADEGRLCDAGLRAGRRVYVVGGTAAEARALAAGLAAGQRLPSSTAHFLIDEWGVVLEGACPAPGDRIAAEIATALCEACGPCLLIDLDTEERWGSET